MQVVTTEISADSKKKGLEPLLEFSHSHKDSDVLLIVVLPVPLNLPLRFLLNHPCLNRWCGEAYLTMSAQIIVLFPFFPSTEWHNSTTSVANPAL